MPTILEVPPRSESGSGGQLLRIVGVGFGLAVTVGSTIGGGILRTPGEIAGHLPSPGLILAIWVAGGLYALLGANAMAELATMTPRSGGQYVFAQRALGPYAGFLTGWSDWLGSCGSTAAVAIIIGEYLGTFVPALEPHPAWGACAIVLLFALLQWRGMREGSRVQQVTTALKALAFLALVAACFSVPRPVPDALGPPLLPSGLAFGVAVLLSLQAVIYTYDGYYSAIYFSGENRNPGRDLPRSIFGGVWLVIGLYLLVNAAFLYVLPLRELAAEPLAAGAAARRVFGERGDAVIRALAIAALLSSVNANLMSASRTLYGLGRDRLFSSVVTRVNRGGTPTTSLLVGTAAALLFAATGAFGVVLALMAFFFVATYTMSFLSLFVLRLREPAARRPYRARGHPWTTGLALVGSLAFLVSAVMADTQQSGYAALILLSSIPLYFLTRWLLAR
jgi:basic amino acid/polyamine antiporter, APA family